MKAKNTFLEQIELWLKLLFLTSLGWSIGLILTSVFIEVINTKPSSTVSLILAGILGGLIISILSLFVIHAFIQSIGSWVLTTTLGWALGLLGTIYSIQVIPGAMGWIVGGTVGGLIYGLAQSYGSKSGLERSVRWLILVMLGWAGTYGLGYTIPSNFGIDRIAFTNAAIAKGLLGWVMLGTFAVLILILLFSTLGHKDRGPKVQWWP